MARVDYEAALQELTTWIATAKPGYGRQELLVKMAELQERHRVPEDLLEKAVRLYGRAVNMPETTPTLGRAEPAPLKDGDHRPPTTRGGHDDTTHPNQEPVLTG